MLLEQGRAALGHLHQGLIIPHEIVRVGIDSIKEKGRPPLETPLQKSGVFAIVEQPTRQVMGTNKAHHASLKRRRPSCQIQRPIVAGIQNPERAFNGLQIIKAAMASSSPKAQAQDKTPTTRPGNRAALQDFADMERALIR
jgi:hypothetical protein